MMGVGGLLLALVVHTVLASSDTSSESMAKVRFGDDGMLVLFRNASEDVLHCTGTIEAANVRIAGTTTTVADVIRQLATLQSDMEEMAALRQEMAAVNAFVGMMPPPASPPPALPPWPPLNLTVTPAGKYTGYSELASTSTLHAADRSYTFNSIPTELDGCTYFQPCCHIDGWNGLNLTMRVSRPARMYICAEVGGSGRDCGFHSSLATVGFTQTSFAPSGGTGIDTCWEKDMDVVSLAVTLPAIVGKPPSNGVRPHALECVHGTFICAQS